MKNVANPDPFNFGKPDPDSFYETDWETNQGSTKSSAKIMENFNKNYKNIIHFFYIKLMFNGHKYLPHK